MNWYNRERDQHTGFSNTKSIASLIYTGDTIKLRECLDNSLILIINRNIYMVKVNCFENSKNLRRETIRIQAS